MINNKLPKIDTKLVGGFVLLTLTAILLFMVLSRPGWVPGPQTTASPPQSIKPSPSTSEAAAAPPSATPGTNPSLTPPVHPTSQPLAVWFDPALPPTFSDRFRLPRGYRLTADKGQADLSVSYTPGENLGYWTYALVSPFPSLEENVSFDTLRSFWNGDSPGLYKGRPLYLDESTLRVFSARWGHPDPAAVEILPAEELSAQLWENPQNWALLPFHQLTPRWKVLTVDQISPLDQNFQPQDYPLTFGIFMTGPREALSPFQGQDSKLTNRDPGKMTHVILTGVTALVRDTAAIMEEKGIIYPAENIGETLRSADFTHVSNEVPFAEDCPAPGSGQAGYYFCSRDSYLKLLTFIGTDIVELSGDHFGDWGEEAMYHTLDLYQEQGWLTYGGGRNYQDGIQPVKFTHNGNQIAFIGCNAKAGKKYAPASETEPGASRCDFPWMKEEIQRLTREGYLTITTMQHDEIYQYKANYLQQRDFRSLAESGAVIVSGSQAHQPQGMEFYQESFIHYGLGNLFFDQYLLSQRVKKYQDADKAFIDLHVFYRNQHINTILIPIQFIDNAQPRLMTKKEKLALLKATFAASIW